MFSTPTEDYNHQKPIWLAVGLGLGSGVCRKYWGFARGSTSAASLAALWSANDACSSRGRQSPGSSSPTAAAEAVASSSTMTAAACC